MRRCNRCGERVRDGSRLEAREVLPNGHESREAFDFCAACWESLCVGQMPTR